MAATPMTGEATCTLTGRPATVTLKATGDGLVLTFEGQAVPAGSTVLYSALVYDAAGETGGQLGMKFIDGEQVGYFFFDSGTSEQTNVDGAVDVSGTRVTGSFPVQDLGTLGQTGVDSWSAALSVNGDDVGVCPGGMDLLPFPG